MTFESNLAATKPIDNDNGVDEGIRDCLQLGSGKGFITFAGAGSGKTYSLKKALDHLKAEYGTKFSRSGKQVAVVTFTNNAADEISERVERNSVFAISTIHSFCWLNISGFNEDIRSWYQSTIPTVLEDLIEKERRGRSGATSDARKRSIIRLTEKLEWLSEPRSFIYDPNSVNSEQNALSHADVLKIFVHFLISKPMMADVLANKYPFIFVDESQDTDKAVINALFSLQNMKNDKLVIGLFGDTMQRIFGGGEPLLGSSLPVDWITYDKEMNHRSTRRVIGLGNTIRQKVDGRIQYARDGAGTGFVRFFLLPHGTTNKDDVERDIREHMAKTVGDAGWNDPKADETAVLLLEHKMVSRRLGFAVLTDALSKSTKIKDRIFEGDNTELNFFANIVLPLVEAGQVGDDFEIMTILRSHKSPLLEETTFLANEDDPLLAARNAERNLRAKASESGATLRGILDVVAEHRLLFIPNKLKSFVAVDDDDDDLIDGLDVELVSTQIADSIVPVAPIQNDEIDAWDAALDTPFDQVRGYRNYINGNSIYRTHQGVKGNEFERVMVIMDDDEAGGFMFSYEQYFGAKDPSASTIAKIAAKEETGLDRTRRLFYVTSTRAKDSLAHVIYTSEIEKVRQSLMDQNFACMEEIIIWPLIADELA